MASTHSSHKRSHSHWNRKSTSDNVDVVCIGISEWVFSLHFLWCLRPIVLLWRIKTILPVSLDLWLAISLLNQASSDFRTAKWDSVIKTSQLHTYIARAWHCCLAHRTLLTLLRSYVYAVHVCMNSFLWTKFDRVKMCLCNFVSDHLSFSFDQTKEKKTNKLVVPMARQASCRPVKSAFCDASTHRT